MSELLKISLPDGSTREMPLGSTPADVAMAIGPGLAKAALAARVNGELVDLSRPFSGDARLALVTSRGRFFPDFVAELTDGRIAVVEYKGAHLLNDPYEIEKRQIGELWAHKSGGTCVFGQIAKERDGVGLSGQLDRLLG